MPHKNVIVGMPTLRGEMKVQTALSLVEACNDCRNHNIEAMLHAWVGDSILPCARNGLLSLFYMDKSLTDLVFWDDDIACAPGSLTKLLSHDVDFVAATYIAKQEDTRWLYQGLPGPPVMERGLIEVKAMPTGFMRITRKAVDMLVEAYNDRQYDPGINDGGLDTCWCLFDWPYNGKELVGEDFGFCQKWRAIGGKIWMDPFIELTHVGIKKYGPVSMFNHLKKVADAA